MNKVYTDMIGRQVPVNGVPRKIVSLVPSQTEFLYALGLEHEIVAQTLFCIHPAEKFKTALKVGGTKKINFEKIEAVSPDLIICNKEENTEEIVERLSEKFPVWVSDINNVEQAFTMMTELSRITGRLEKGLSIITDIRKNLAGMKKYHAYSCVYLIWRNPLICVGQSTFINSMLEVAGFKNCIQEKRYPEISIEELQLINPQLILLSSEPYPFTEKHQEEIQRQLPAGKTMLVDGEMFSWYGNRMRDALAYFEELQRKLHKTKR